MSTPYVFSLSPCPARLELTKGSFVTPNTWKDSAAADCLVVVAGMEGALPSVVGGLVGVPLVAVPTSIGYGASFGGVAALLAMLNSCAPGVSVVNIDNGFGAGVFAARVARNARPHGETP